MRDQAPWRGRIPQGCELAEVSMPRACLPNGYTLQMSDTARSRICRAMTTNIRSAAITATILLFVAAAGDVRAQTVTHPAGKDPAATVVAVPAAQPVQPASPEAKIETGITTQVAPDVSKDKQNPNASRPGEPWTGRDYAAIFSGVAGFLAFFAAITATVVSSRANRANLVSKTNESELSVIEKKLDGFFGPYLRLSETNSLLHQDLKARQQNPATFRTLIHLLDPQWRANTTAGDQTIIDEIMRIDGQLELLIRKSAGTLDINIQPYLARASAHFRMIRLAHKGKLDQDVKRFEKYVYPRSVDGVLQLEVSRLEARRATLRLNPGFAPAPMDKLTIPTPLQLPPWV